MEGYCTKCKSEMIEYGTTKNEDNSIGYNYICENCKHEGIEWYTLQYDCTE